MDTTEELYGYFYAGMPNLSAGELFFWIMVDETMKQLGIDDIVAVTFVLALEEMISLLGQNQAVQLHEHQLHQNIQEYYLNKHCHFKYPL